MKVLGGAGGFGQDSWIIAGIEYAAEGPDATLGTGDEADVINMSLGDSINGDGTDPMSQAVDLAVSQGLVVAIAAGNDGPGMSTLGRPGVARDAITVGATDDSDTMAGFSSRGPTLDLRLKPDVTAPGVSILSADAGGTGYASLQGTSMATPHVAGAAALLLQANPTWDPRTVKAALMGTALVLNGPRLWDQGAGRIRPSTAITTTVVVTPPSVSLGTVFTTGQVTSTLTLVNLSGSPIPVTLSVTTTVTSTGVAISSVTPSSTTLPANSTTTVQLVVDPDQANPEGYYEGRVTVPFLFLLEAAATNQLANGGFEMGDFTSWTRSETGFGRFEINDGTVDPVGPETTTPPFAGSYSAFNTSPAPGFRSISQAVYLTPDLTAATLHWTDRIRNHHTAFVEGQQEFAVQVLDSNLQLLEELYSTDPGDPLLNDWVTRSADLSAYIGQTVWIAFQQGDVTTFFNVYLDEISISTVSGALPTVPSIGLWGLIATASGLAGAVTLLGHRRRRRYVAALHQAR